MTELLKQADDIHKIVNDLSTLEGVVYDACLMYEKDGVCKEGEAFEEYHDLINATIESVKALVDSVNKIQQYREALEFYADKENVWYDELTGGIFELNPDSDDFGDKARNALKEQS